MKGIVLAGGTGSRLAPLTWAVNKHLLPLGDRPMICWAVEALAAAGVTEAMVVTGLGLTGQFDRVLDGGRAYGLQLRYASQARPLGIPDAITRVGRWAAGEPVMVLLGDNVFGRSLRGVAEAYAGQGGGARVVLAEVEDTARLRQYGVAELEGGRIVRVVEKPAAPPTRCAVVGAYFYDADVFEIAQALDPSLRGETEICDVNNHYLERGLLEHSVIQGFWGDAGESIEAYYRVNDHVRAHGANHP